MMTLEVVGVDEHSVVFVTTEAEAKNIIEALNAEWTKRLIEEYSRLYTSNPQRIDMDLFTPNGKPSETNKAPFALEMDYWHNGGYYYEEYSTLFEHKSIEELIQIEFSK